MGHYWLFEKAEILDVGFRKLIAEKSGFEKVQLRMSGRLKFRLLNRRDVLKGRNPNVGF